MIRRAGVLALFVIAGTTAGFARQDARPLLDAARTAMGGATVLDAIRTLSARGSMTRTRGPISSQSQFEFDYAVPDRYVYRTTETMGQGGPFPFTASARDGFNVDRVIHELAASNGRQMEFPLPPPTTAQGIADLAATRLRAQKITFARMMLPLFAAAPAAYPVTFAVSGEDRVGTALADVVDVRHTDGFAAKLYLDRTTHLPILLTWMDAPRVVMSTSQMVITGPTNGRPGGPPAPAPPPSFPAGDPTVGLAPVEYQLAIADYRSRNGINWPTHLTLTVSGRVQEDTRISSFTINPTIDPKRFAP
jgi:hypothetical protein